MSSSQPNLNRSLSLFDSVCIMVGIIVGVGVFESSSTIAANLSSDLAVLGMWAIGGILSLAGALCYAELSAAYPEEGGDYVYLTKAYGKWAGFLFAWGRFIIVQPGSIAAMAFPCARYILIAFPDAQQFGSKSIGIAAIVLCTLFNIAGLQCGKWTQNILTENFFPNIRSFNRI